MQSFFHLAGPFRPNKRRIRLSQPWHSSCAPSDPCIAPALNHLYRKSLSTSKSIPTQRRQKYACASDAKSARQRKNVYRLSWDSTMCAERSTMTLSHSTECLILSKNGIKSLPPTTKCRGLFERSFRKCTFVDPKISPESFTCRKRWGLGTKC